MLRVARKNMKKLLVLTTLCLFGLIVFGPDTAKPMHGAGDSQPPTFNKEVVRIFQANCQSCHHPGDIAPFSMMDYVSTRPWARSIKEQVLLKTMPPWKPSQGADVFRSARILSQRDIDAISAWVDAGSPEG